MIAIPVSSQGLIDEIIQLRAEVTRLRAELTGHRFSKDFNCPRLPVLEERWANLDHSAYALVYWDMDGLNALNFRYGDEGVHQRARSAYSLLRNDIRQGDELYLRRGGDEFLMPLSIEDAEAVANRLLALLKLHGLSATFAIVQATPNLEVCIEQADRLVKRARGGARGEGRRGFVVSDLVLA